MLGRMPLFFYSVTLSKEFLLIVTTDPSTLLLFSHSETDYPFLDSAPLEVPQKARFLIDCASAIGKPSVTADMVASRTDVHLQTSMVRLIQGEW